MECKHCNIEPCPMLNKSKCLINKMWEEARNWEVAKEIGIAIDTISLMPLDKVILWRN